MTFPKDQIQALIAEIDSVLQKTTPRLPWVMSGEATQQRRVLERVRNYLIALQKRMVAEEGFGQAGVRTDSLAYQPQAQYPQPQGYGSQSYNQEMAAQQMLQSVVQEMGYLRSKVMQPLMAELDGLRQQRESLVQEIRQLEGQRQGYTFGQPQSNQQQIIAEFLQVLMGRLQESLSQQVTQTLKDIADQPHQPLPYGSDPRLTGAPPLGTSASPMIDPRIVQAQSDQLLINMDSTLRIVFEALQRDIKAYQASLSQGLDRMHTLGQQGEMMFTALITHLAQQLGREASSYLQATSTLPELQPTPPTSPAPAPTSEAGDRSLPATPPAQGSAPSSTTPPAQASSPTTGRPVAFPYPGIELPTPSSATPAPASSTESPPSTAIDAGIDAWLRSASSAGSGAKDSGDSTFGDLNLADLDLSNLDLSHLSPGDIDSLLDGEVNAGLSDLPVPNQSATPASSSPTGSLASTATPAGPVTSGVEMGPIDATLKNLLEQLGGDWDATPDTPSVAEADAQINQLLSSTPSPASGSPGTPATEPAHDDLDEFYESLFGSTASSALPSSSAPAAPPVQPAAPEGAPAQAGSPGAGTLPSASSSSALPTPDPTLGWDLTPPASSTAATPVPQANSLNTDSLNQVADLDSISTLADLFDRFPPDPTEAIAPTALDHPSLSPEAAGSSTVPSPLPPSQSLETALPSEHLEDQYIPASPDENLLPTQESTESDLRFWLDETTLNHLSTDLSNLEAGFGAQEGFPLTPGLGGVELGVDASGLTLDDFLSEPSSAPAASPSTTEEDWSALSLDDFASALPLDQPVSGTAAGDRPTPSSATPEVDLSLAEMADLFGDAPTIESAPSAMPSVDDETSGFTLEGMDDLFADVPLVGEPSVPSTSLASDPSQEAGFTLEGIDDLFADTPTLTSQPTAPAVSPAPSADQSAVLSLEGIEDLFADAPSSSPATPEPQTAAFTLEGMEDLFADAPATGTAASAAPSAAPPTVPPTVAPSSAETSATSSSFTLERMGDLFVEVPSASANPAPTAPEPPGAFTLEQRNGVFVEMPSNVASQPSESNSEKKTSNPS